MLSTLFFFLLLSMFQVYLYTRQRIPTLNEYCVVCDQDHVFQNGSMLQVRVPLCIHNDIKVLDYIHHNQTCYQSFIIIQNILFTWYKYILLCSPIDSLVCSQGLNGKVCLIEQK